MLYTSKTISFRIFLMNFFYGHVKMNADTIVCGEQQVLSWIGIGMCRNFMANGHSNGFLASKSLRQFCFRTLIYLCIGEWYKNIVVNAVVTALCITCGIFFVQWVSSIDDNCTKLKLN